MDSMTEMLVLIIYSFMSLRKGIQTQFYWNKVTLQKNTVMLKKYHKPHGKQLIVHIGLSVNFSFIFCLHILITDCEMTNNRIYNDYLSFSFSVISKKVFALSIVFNKKCHTSS